MRRLETAAATHTGQLRERNEDAYARGERVFAVADGIGGNVGGDVASSTALLPVMRLESQVFGDIAAAQKALVEAITAANSTVLQKASKNPDLHGMGTTLTAAIIDNHHLHVGHVGDSRAYLIRSRQMSQLTHDHTAVAELIARGELTAGQVSAHPLRSTITRAVGVQADVDVDVCTIDLIEGDQILLCSDGLTKPLSENEILSILINEQDTDMAVQRLIRSANDCGGPDNITVLLLRYKGSATSYSEQDTPRDFSGPSVLPHQTEGPLARVQQKLLDWYRRNFGRDKH